MRPLPISVTSTKSTAFSLSSVTSSKCGQTFAGRAVRLKSEKTIPPSASAKPNNKREGSDASNQKHLDKGGSSDALSKPEQSKDTVTSGSLEESGKPKTKLHREALSGGVKNATTRFELPTPAVAVRNLVEQAQYGHLCTVMSAMHHKRAGYPFGSVIDFACDGAGYPIFSLSPLAMHTRNLLADPRCTLVVQMPGWQGLSNARVTIFGSVYPLPDNMQPAAREIFRHKHATEEGEEWIGGNYSYYRMHHISDIYFVGGFGTVQWVEVDDYVKAEPDHIVINRMQATLQVLNEKFSARLRELLSTYEQQANDAAIISIDKQGIDVKVRLGHDYMVERVGFAEDVHTVDHAVSVLTEITSGPDVFARYNRSWG
uniref:Pyridoxamine 5-phosphate oxidase family protein n=1 Tax=Tetraselmis sp. GSL018 TaxID=582737 RepID=A0A061S6D3_9CHLO|mmetsp:Transcript_9059/g.21818  ORF Transcript_9059/g.21818 Transcript_9059/m.21818 type:complete len:372 (+) Transcript_9059:180-1295(+)|eukprot:CAMPEP_0177602374 /NCGR_PEP_ID=MMETSP0419_2-20121207/14824_1 /TAXON_ID=582737 /ORGANISM="Tetraselmis sp., Strain GSL018" /LENGTH=371 /DNA_ID=CAMNT_0019095833 /DNA_START=156 /DNA_END=1271 /DNA_ORIENTATION=-